MAPTCGRQQINALGDAFAGFCGLVRLDLSRNLLRSLQGLQHLPQLQWVSAYYNQIASFEALEPLQSLAHLTELDLRLNPVTRHDDYRRCVRTAAALRARVRLRG